MYGVELTTLVKMHSTKVPVVVKECIEEIERRGELDRLWASLELPHWCSIVYM